MNPLRALREHGQSVWLDYIRRDLIESGELRRLIEADGVAGLTSNPAIFAQAFAGSDAYDVQIRELATGDPEISAEALYEALAIRDIRMAADLLRPTWEATDGADGFVSLEVSPHLARDTDGTLADARRLWRLVDRPNLMIKIPSTAEGIPAVEEALAEGINVNITLMFSLGHYEATAAAYLRGAARARRPERLASVASFFVSRVDSKVDAALVASGGAEARELLGTIAIANSKLAYRRFQEIFEGDGFAALRSRRVRPQRVLWASTSTKNPAYRDVVYAEELIGDQTVNTLPPQTLEAFRDHGQVRQSLTEGVDEARARIARLGELGIDLEAVTTQLQEDGVRQFSEPFDKMLAALDQKRRELLGVAPAAEHRS